MQVSKINTQQTFQAKKLFTSEQVKALKEVALNAEDIEETVKNVEKLKKEGYKIRAQGSLDDGDTLYLEKGDEIVESVREGYNFIGIKKLLDKAWRFLNK